MTGATGFVGSRIIDVLSFSEQFTPIAAVRNDSNQLDSQVKSVVVDSLSSDNSWELALKNIEVVIHTAARVHVMSDSSKDPLSEYRKVNVDGTLNLARQSASTGVKRFVFISSIKVNGESTPLNNPFTDENIPTPIDFYGVSKFETEQELFKLGTTTGMEIDCIRPVLVYGPGVKANFLSMMKWLYKGVHLPFGSIHNKRSLVALDNLVDLILTCIEHPNAANEMFLVSDGEDLSTTELLNRVSNALGKKTWLFPVNQKVLEFCLGLIGKKNLAQRLCGSLQVDISKTKKLLNWTPPITVDEGLRKTAEYFIESQKSKDSF